MFEGLEKSEPDKTLLTQYRLVSKSDAGRRMLADILVNFCHFCSYIDPDDKKAIGEYNVGVAILSRLGLFTAGKESIVNAIMNIPIAD